MLVKRRITTALALLLAAMPLAAQTQQAGKVWRIGYLAGSPRVPQIDAFVQGLRDLGYVEGQNLVLEMKLAHGRIDQIPELAADLVRLKPHVIVAAANVAGLAAKKATSAIPIVVIASHDGVKVGLFASLARPGGNVTGLESLAPDLDAKRLEWLKHVIPTLSRIALLYNPLDPGGSVHVDITMRTARSLGIQVRLVQVRSAAEFDSALMAALRDRPDALLTVTDPLVFAHRERIAQFTLEHRLPSAHEYKAYADFGGLMSYGPNMSVLWRRAAYYVDRILKGATPGGLPVEQPTQFELVINLKSAKALGLTIPPTLLLQANHIIE
ncbi:MAG: ABC transporter substrate-binding protein [Candidatus Rokuibacteriota bacterium]